MDIGLKQCDQPDHGGQDDAVPEDGLEDVGFLPDLIGGGRGHADALGVDHLPHDAARAVRGGNKHLELLAR